MFKCLQYLLVLATFCSCSFVCAQVRDEEKVAFTHNLLKEPGDLILIMTAMGGAIPTTFCLHYALTKGLSFLVEKSETCKNVHNFFANSFSGSDKQEKAAKMFDDAGNVFVWGGVTLCFYSYLKSFFLRRDLSSQPALFQILLDEAAKKEECRLTEEVVAVMNEFTNQNPSFVFDAKKNEHQVIARSVVKKARRAFFNASNRA
jgi:hypothetical protein